jgi:hypothetical protein
LAKILEKVVAMWENQIIIINYAYRDFQALFNPADWLLESFVAHTAIKAAGR